jgi:hypothetical protein
MISPTDQREVLRQNEALKEVRITLLHELQCAKRDALLTTEELERATELNARLVREVRDACESVETG